MWSMGEKLEKILYYDNRKLLSTAFNLELKFERQLEERKIPKDDLTTLLYVRGLDKIPGVDIRTLPTWEGLDNDFRNEIYIELEFEALGMSSIAKCARTIKQFYDDPAYRSRILSLYAEAFKQFCEDVNAGKIS